MAGFCLTFLAVLLAGLGARDHALVAALSRAQGKRPGVLVSACVVAIVSTLLAAWLGALASLLPGPARGLLAGLVLLFAGAQALILSPHPAPQEPTLSLAALAIVLASLQLTDAARLTVFALALCTNAPVPVAMGGAVGAGALIGAAWRFPESFAHPSIRLARRMVGAALLLIGLYLCLAMIGQPGLAGC
jgi:hypothetical protein